MTATTARTTADAATRYAANTVTQEGVPYTAALSLVMRSSVLQLVDLRGGLDMAQRLRAMADEVEGGV